ncbi:MAG: tRNA (adenosine(37)-N6)-threonylcarbamoyltransferase complex ATPase subunit type 1 TsaE [Betaproteobacteria bacterium]|jgi:tRNA threonylcarbamoyladenosine biosynthesis protein TsaE|nr:tRNA (adenosine(37)-N6)-threonylcarbamoyltransferase complex ATPase subunit type 1 TsaE [Betaproteobacteria bacterium]NBP44486.1 tRNA (adenosine(37)-N6)-threonylcarbamoyltransferase complex ATPase subunit type 1 TsaE [Betaproteobacteria bacterium]
MALTIQRHDTSPPLAGPIVGIDQWLGEADAQAMAQRLSRVAHLDQGRIALQGELGAGKTTLVRHLLRALGVQGPIKSPTYAVLEQHQADAAHGGFEILHFDCYRFEDPQEWDDAGFRELWDGPGLKLCEWPQKVPGLVASADWLVNIGFVSAEQREVRITAQSPLGQAWLQALQEGGEA